MKNSTHKSGAWKSFVANRQLISKVIMRIQLLFLMILITAMHTFGNAAAQSVSISAKGDPLAKVLDQIESQTGYYLGYRTDMVESYRVTVEIKNANIEQALDACLKNLPIIYKISGKFVTLSKRNDRINELASPSYGPERRPIKGTVTTKVGEPFPGATVRVKGTSKVTVTDKDGRYSVDANKGDVLVFSFVGFHTVELLVSNQNEIDAVLTELVNQLTETVVKGYYSTTKELNTGSVSTLRASEIAKQPVSDPMMALQGRIPGLSVRQESGVPGAELTIQIRGRNSIGGGSAPFFIVDGVPFNSESLDQNANAAQSLSPFSSIRPEDIESIDVLKDADATAIYGSRGANGVILITTKKGRAGKTKVDFNIYQGLSNVSRFLKLMTTEQYLEMRREAYKNDGLSIPDRSTAGSSSNYDLTTWDTSRYTDWQRELIGGTARSTNASGAISGGSANTQFLLGMSYRKETTVYPGDANNEIVSGNLNINYLSDNKKFKTDVSINLSANNNKLPQTDLVSFIFSAPNAPAIYNGDGSLNWENSTFNNFFRETLRTSSTATDNFLNNIKLQYQLMSGLSISSSFGYNYQAIRERNIIPFSSFNPTTTNADLRRSHTRAQMQVKSWIIEPQLNYSRTFGRHRFEALGGLTFQARATLGLQETASGFATDALIENFSGGTTKSNFTDTDIEYKYTAAYARLGYIYGDRYIFNLTGRRDGSSRFGPKTRFGNFGAVGIAWLWSKERFIDRLPFISHGKIRASLGRTGNDQLADYGYYSNYTTVSAAYLGLSTLVPSGLNNPYYGWENIDKFEGALEVGLLKNRITSNFSFYRNRTKNQLVGYSLSTVTGYSSVTANFPAVVENKGWEIELSSVNLNNKNFTWSTNFNISFPKNRLVSFPGIEKTGYVTRFQPGMPLSSFFAFRYTGIDSTSGLYTFEDKNKDNSINDADKYFVFLGQTCFGGVANTLRYKDFTFDIFLQFVKQKGYKEESYVLPGTIGYNQLSILTDRWKNSSELGSFQRYSISTADPYVATQFFSQSDAMITDASFIRLKNAMLSWSVPNTWRNSLHLSNARVYVQAQNLFTWTKYRGLSLDPEGNSVGSRRLAPLRTIAFGLQITL